MSQFKAALLSVLVFTCVEAKSSLNPQAMSPQNNNQLVNLNFQIKSKNKMINSEFMMPFNQTAELEKMIGNKNVLIEINPRRGRNPGEIALDMKFYRSSGAKAFYKKEIIAKLNENSSVSYRGMSFKIRPVLNKSI